MFFLSKTYVFFLYFLNSVLFNRNINLFYNVLMLSAVYCIKRHSVGNGTGKRYAVGVFYIVAYAYSTAQRRNFNTEIFNRFIYIKTRSVTFHSCGQGKYNLLYVFLCHTLHQLLYPYVARTYAVHGRDNPSLDMVYAVERIRILYCHNVPNVFHHANQRTVAAGVAANLTFVAVRNRIAMAAEFDLAFQINNGLCQLIDLRLVFA